MFIIILIQKGGVSMFAIMTCENYNCTQSVNVLKEQTRSLNVKDYNNVNYDPSRSDKNVILYHDNNLERFSSFRSFVKDFYEKEDIQGRFNIDTVSKRATTTMSSFVASGSKDFIESFKNRDELIDYYKNALNFLKEEYPGFHLLDARVHFDEKGLPHMHASFLPLVYREDGTRQFNVSKVQKGKDYFRGFQDRYYNYMREKYPDRDLERTNPNRDHARKLTVKEYKEFKEIQREFKDRADELRDKIDKLKDLEKQVDDRDKDLVDYRDYLDKVDAYCEREGLTVYQYQKEVFYADRGYRDYPAPEYHNPERDLIREREEQQHTREHDRDR